MKHILIFILLPVFLSASYINNSQIVVELAKAHNLYAGSKASKLLFSGRESSLQNTISKDTN